MCIVQAEGNEDDVEATNASDVLNTYQMSSPRAEGGACGISSRRADRRPPRQRRTPRLSRICWGKCRLRSVRFPRRTIHNLKSGNHTILALNPANWPACSRHLPDGVSETNQPPT